MSARQVSTQSVAGGAVVPSRVLGAQNLNCNSIINPIGADGVTITLTDVRAALAIGLVTPAAGEDPVTAGLRQLIDRQLIGAEVPA